MFARLVTFRLKPETVSRLPRLIEYEILPILRIQRGFRDLVTLVNHEKSQAIGISIWNNKADAEAYNQTGYSQVLKSLSPVVDGSPAVETLEVSAFDIANSTFYNRALGKGA